MLRLEEILTSKIRESIESRDADTANELLLKLEGLMERNHSKGRAEVSALTILLNSSIQTISMLQNYAAGLQESLEGADKQNKLTAFVGPRILPDYPLGTLESILVEKYGTDTSSMAIDMPDVASALQHLRQAMEWEEEDFAELVKQSSNVYMEAVSLEEEDEDPEEDDVNDEEAAGGC